MKLAFLKRPLEDQSLMIRETASQRGLLPVMVEKDFWVSWTLAVLFAHPELGGHLVFKGGTSLSKVFSAIDRFSEDIDVSVSPAFLGISEDVVEKAATRNQREGFMAQMEKACTECVHSRFLRELEKVAREALGERPGGLAWMEFQIDAHTHSPVILFHYPSHEGTGFEYLKRSVKLEFGSLTDQRPSGTHAVRPWVAEVFPKLFEDFRCDAVVLDLERTFWEKATILHAEAHRDSTKPLRDRYSRHYSDMAALSRHTLAERALSLKDLRQRVADWKSRFFAASWARYDLIKAGTFRLVPPEFRLVELEKDYREMRDMFLVEPPPFESVMESIRSLEKRIAGTL